MISRQPSSTRTYTLFPDTTCFRSIFDKGNSARAAVLAMGGAHHALGSAEADGESLAFQPLADIALPGERSWAAEWIAALLGAEYVPVTPVAKETIWTRSEEHTSELQSLRRIPYPVIRLNKKT